MDAEIEEKDYVMAKYILDILKLQQPIVWSWGIDPNSVDVVQDGISFHVQGFIMKDTVIITYDQGKDLFRIELHPDDAKNERIQIFTDIYLDNIVSVIDDHVEKCENYEERVSQEYPIVIISDLLNDEDCEGK